MRNDARLKQSRTRNADQITHHGLTTAKNMRGDSARCDGAVSVVDISDVRYVDDAINIGHVPNVGDVNQAQVVATIVIPRKERLARSKWEPRRYTAPNRDREARAPDKRNERRRIDWESDNRSGKPSPGTLYQDPSAIMERAKTPRFIFHPSPTPGIDPGCCGWTARSLARYSTWREGSMT